MPKCCFVGGLNFFTFFSTVLLFSYRQVGNIRSRNLMFFSLSFCDRLFSQLHQLERDSLRRLECLGRRVEAAALVARARAAR